MILYCYDKDGVLTGPVSPALSPARPFVDGRPNHIRPARATEMVPPAAGPGTVPVFDGSSWALVEDHRGTMAYSTATRDPMPVTTLGPLPDGFVDTAPPSPAHTWDGSAWVEDESLLLMAARKDRNDLLTASDWTQLADVPLAGDQKTAWALYRQALRDYPEGWTKDKPWPAKPGE